MLYILGIFICFPCFSNSDSLALVKAARQQIGVTLFYDSGYRSLAFPKGDPPENVGVCTDVIIRAYRKAFGEDLQELIYKDRKASLENYPLLWGEKSPDPNIDHRRVPNLQFFFKRYGRALPITEKPEDYRPGDIVTWYLNPNGSVPHIGIVSDRKENDQTTPLIIHNIGEGVKEENILFHFKVSGHYRYKL